MSVKQEAAVLLRPHHGMCLAFFEGKGYSEAFTLHTQHMLQVLEAGAKIQLVVRTDAICAACPNAVDGVCRQKERVRRFDEAVLKLCGVTEETVLHFSEFTDLVETQILSQGKRREVCGGCQWESICEKGVKEKYLVQCFVNN